VAKLGLLLAALTLAGFAAASVIAASGSAATCTAAQRSQRAATAAAYAKAMPTARKRYYARHKSAALRTRFVRQQQARLAALRAAAACTLAPTTTVTTTTVPTDPALAYQFGPGMTSAAETTVKGYVDRAAGDLITLTGVTVKATAYVSTDPNWLGQTECDAGGIHDQGCYTSVANQFASGYTIAIGAPGGTWVDWGASDFQSDPPALLQKILAHELFHVVQAQLGMPDERTVPIDQPRRGGPNWLIEGSAEYIGYRVAGDLGLQAYATSLAHEKSVASSVATPLDQLMTIQQSQFTSFYELSEVAVDHLVAETSISALVDYFRELGAGKSWQDAFQGAFGRTIDAFDADFAAYRAKL
jgi:hypothetical protein